MFKVGKSGKERRREIHEGLQIVPTGIDNGMPVWVLFTSTKEVYDLGQVIKSGIKFTTSKFPSY